MNLDVNTKNLRVSTFNLLKAIEHDVYIFAALLFLSILGVGITDASVQTSHWYWTAMIPVFFAACLFLEWHNKHESGLEPKTIVIKQILHWLGLLAGFYLVFFLRDMGSLDNQTTGLILLLMLALGTFLAGVRMGWLFKLLGIFLGLCLVLVAYMENYFAVIIALSVAMLIAYRLLAKVFTNHSRRE